MVASKKRARTSSSDAKRPAKSARKTKTAEALLTSPGRQHGSLYHRPQMLERPESIQSLLDWFQGVSRKRNMPWRQTWIDPETEEDVDARLKKRAYEVWISEIMLQQTRVETVKGYWTNWMAKWPTIDDLAAANPDEVLSAWRGLGYYSRATRIHTAAQKVVGDEKMKGMLPELPEELEKQVPGVGRYTAGAISSIVFGHAVPILDGNVVRVLSRQLALYANPKSKATTDLLWSAADKLVKKAAGGNEDEEIKRSKVPGMWNQALMELGSTVCTPKPICVECPIRGTCRAYAEGELLAKEQPTVEPAISDVEDLCTLCEPIIQDDEPPPPPPAAKPSQKLRQPTLNFGGAKKSAVAEEEATTSVDAVERHVKLFPMKVAKKQIRTEECVVCIIQRMPEDERTEVEYLIEQRPDTGLLASLWQFPSLTTLEDGNNLHGSTSAKALSEKFATQLVGCTVKHASSLGSVAHVFSHLKLLMHVHLVTLSGDAAEQQIVNVVEKVKNKNFGTPMQYSAKKRWATAIEIEAESMGTGMRNCWALIHASL